MTGFVTSATPEPSDAGARNNLITTENAPPGTFGEIAGAEFNRGLYPSYLRYMQYLGEKTRDAYIEPQPRMAPSDIKEQYGLDVKAPMPEYQAQYMAHAQELEKHYDMVTRNASGIKTFGADTAAWLVDPINVGASFIPYVGEARVAAGLTAAGVDTSTMAGRAAVRGITYGAQGVGVQAPLSAVKYGLSQTNGVDYSVANAMRDTLFAGVLGTGLGSVFGAVSAAITKGTPEWAAVKNQKFEDKAAQATAGITQLGKESPVETYYPVFESSGVLGMTDKELGKVSEEAAAASRDLPASPDDALSDLKERGDALEAQLMEAHKDNPEMQQALAEEPQIWKQHGEMLGRAYDALQNCMLR